MHISAYILVHFPCVPRPVFLNLLLVNAPYKIMDSPEAPHSKM
ncbi:unnamed protein product [Staurois parvus]|uniref:Uncharacterized protein n=1 Tax=Staurois parvus TaxID=386267 RepID=A0ABN9EHV8_9NEOB|nr:unnamed protein product [Staurois parvus]